MAKEAAVLASTNIPTDGGPVAVEISTGAPTFIVGQNGAGKSALAQHIFRASGPQAVYLPGGRPVSFDNDALNITPASIVGMTENFRSWANDPTFRYRSINGNLKNEMAIHTVQSKEIQSKVSFANDVIAANGDAGVITSIELPDSPFTKINGLLAQSNLSISVTLVDSSLMIERGGDTYSFAKASDGERSALLLTAEVLAGAPGSVFVIDEPERHLHRSIIVPLIASLIRERSDCAFVVSTHELFLPESFPEAQVVLVRSIDWVETTPSQWSVDVLEANDVIPDDLRADIIGARRKILFVEGKSTSLDQPLYALLFPSCSVIAKEGCAEVRRAVSGLRAAPDLHYVEAYGIVDNDNMSSGEIAAHEADQVYPLPMYSVESLYYSEESIRALAELQAKIHPISADDLVATSKADAFSALTSAGSMSHLAARKSEQAVRERLLAAMPSKADLVAGAVTTVNVASPYIEEQARLNGLIVSGALNQIIDKYPIRESGALGALAKALKFSSRDDFEAAVLKVVGNNATLADKLRAKLGLLATKL